MMDYHTIPGFSNYEITQAGSVRSKTRQIKARWGNMLVAGTNIKPKDADGSVSVAMKNDEGKWCKRTISQLMYRTFIGEIPEGYRLKYKDGDCNNFHVDNLTISEVNKAHAEYCKRYRAGIASGTIQRKPFASTTKTTQIGRMLCAKW